VGHGDDRDEHPTLPRKTHQILQFAPTSSHTDDFEDIELVSYMAKSETAQDIDADVRGKMRYRAGSGSDHCVEGERDHLMI
jgi:hypothetical protein